MNHDTPLSMKYKNYNEPKREQNNGSLGKSGHLAYKNYFKTAGLNIAEGHLNTCAAEKAVA